MKEVGSRTRVMDMVFSLLQMVIATRENGMETLEKAKVPSTGIMDLNLKVNSQKVKRMEMVALTGQMEVST